MKRLNIFLGLGLAVGLAGFAKAVPSNPFPISTTHSAKKPIQDSNRAVFKSSGVVAGTEGFENVQLATGVVKLDSVFVSSPGVNSTLIVRDSNKFSLGNSTFNITPVTGDSTNISISMPYHYESSTQGIVYTATCAVCTAVWTAPKLRFVIERVR